PITKHFVDRESYDQSEKIALFRLFLEPWNVPVNRWSMSVMGRSKTYTFGDVFAVSNRYLNVLKDETEELVKSLKADGVDTKDCDQLISTYDDAVIFSPGSTTGGGGTTGGGATTGGGTTTGGGGTEAPPAETTTDVFEDWYASYLDYLDAVSGGDTDAMLPIYEGEVRDADTTLPGQCTSDPDFNPAADVNGCME
ncbi:MAG: hypothetical protein ACREEM_46735, partial [Blastocatellia bacterium]